MTNQLDHARLKAAREKMKRSQQTMAKMFHVTHATYSRWENGHVQPQPDRREKLDKFIELAEKGGRNE